MAGNESSAVLDTIVLDTTAPSVETRMPKGRNVSPRAKTTVTFSEPMDEGSVEAMTDGKPTSFILKRGAAVLAATVTYVEVSQSGPYKAILKPNRPLRSGVTYTASMTAGAGDLAGNALDQNPSLTGDQPKVWKFTVKS